MADMMPFIRTLSRIGILFSCTFSDALLVINFQPFLYKKIFILYKKIGGEKVQPTNNPNKQPIIQNGLQGTKHEAQQEIR